MGVVGPGRVGRLNRSSGATGAFRAVRDDFDLDEELWTGEPCLDRGTRGEMRSEGRPVDLVHLLEPPDVRQEDGRLDNVLETAPRLLQFPLDVRKDDLGLGLYACGNRSGQRIGTNLARDEDERPRDDESRVWRPTGRGRIDSFDHGFGGYIHSRNKLSRDPKARLI